MSPARETFLAFLKLGLTSFGGPVAHIGYFREEFVGRRRWLSDADFADLTALCQFMPGPASSQLGMAIGVRRAGALGGLAAWTGFTLPSALAMLAFALGVGALGAGGGWLAGLKAAAVAVVAHALLDMARSLCPDRERATVAVAAMIGALLVPGALGQIGVIAAGGLAGLALGTTTLGGPAPGAAPAASAPPPRALSRRAGWTLLALFFLLLALLPIAAQTTGSAMLALADGFYRAGSLVFGGGHVVLPLLEASFVTPGLVSPDAFLAGYGAAQAVPGPLFTFAAYLGAVAAPDTPLLGGGLALIAIFLPSAFLVGGLLPFWETLRARPGARAALNGANAAVVGLLGAALYDPVFLKGAPGALALAVALAAFAALRFWNVPPWAVVAASAAAGAALF